MLPAIPDENYSFFFNSDTDVESRISSSEKGHYHNNFEIYFITKGNVTYFIDDRIYEVQAGDLVIIPDRVLHYTKYYGDRHSRKLINCSRRYIPSALLPTISTFFYLYRNPSTVKDVLELFEKIEKEYTSPDSMSEEIITLYMHMLFYTLERNKENCIDVESQNRYTGEAVEYIKKNFSQKITLGEAAKNLSMSPEHLSRTFRKETGIGFNRYLNLIRLQHAETLLKTTDMTVSEIAEACGFEDSNYFSHKFKELYGISPKKI